MKDATIKLTSKRQATFPREVCESLGVEAGDELELKPRVSEDGERSWTLQKRMASAERRSWFGSLQKYAGRNADHSMDAIRKSIELGRSAEMAEDSSTST